METIYINVDTSYANNTFSTLTDSNFESEIELFGLYKQEQMLENHLLQILCLQLHFLK